MIVFIHNTKNCQVFLIWRNKEISHSTKLQIYSKTLLASCIQRNNALYPANNLTLQRPWGNVAVTLPQHRCATSKCRHPMDVIATLFPTFPQHSNKVATTLFLTFTQPYHNLIITLSHPYHTLITALWQHYLLLLYSF